MLAGEDQPHLAVDSALGELGARCSQHAWEPVESLLRPRIRERNEHEIILSKAKFRADLGRFTLHFGRSGERIEVDAIPDRADWRFQAGRAQVSLDSL